MEAQEDKNLTNEVSEINTFLPKELKESKPTKGKKTRKRSLNLLFGITVTFTVCVFDTTSLACLQLVETLPPDIQINALNFACGLICIIPYFVIKRKIPTLDRSKLIWVTIICVVFIADCLSLYNQEASFLPLGSIGSIGYAFNIIFSVILSKIFLTETVTLHKGLALFVTILGLLLTILAHVPSLGQSYNHDSSCGVLHENGHHVGNGSQLTIHGTSNQTFIPDLTYRGNDTDFIESQDVPTAVKNTTVPFDCNSGPKHKKDLWSEVLSMFLLAFSCFCSALETVILSGSRLKHVNPPVLAFWIFASGSIILIPATFTFEEPIIPQTWMDRMYLLIYCVGAAGLSYCYIIAAQILLPMFLTIIESFGVPLMFIVQMLFLTQIAKPNNIWLQMAGVLLVFLATIALPVVEYLTVKKEEKLKKKNPEVETKI